MFSFIALKRYHEDMGIMSPSLSTNITSGSVVIICGRSSVAVEAVPPVILSVENSAIVSNFSLAIPC